MNKFLEELNHNKQSTFVHDERLEYHIIKQYKDTTISLELPQLKNLDYSITNDQLGGNYLGKKHKKIKAGFSSYFETRDRLLNDITNNNLVYLFDDLHIPIIDKQITDLKHLIQQHQSARSVSFERSALIVLNQDTNDSYQNQYIEDVYVNEIPKKTYLNVFLFVELSASFNEKNIVFVNNFIYQLINTVVKRNGNFVMLNHYYPFIESQQNSIHLFQHIFQKVNLVYFKRLFRTANRIYYVLINKQQNIEQVQFDKPNSIQIHTEISQDILRKMYRFMKRIVKFIRFQMKLIHYLYRLKLYSNSEYRFIIRRIFLLPAVK